MGSSLVLFQIQEHMRQFVSIWGERLQTESGLVLEVRQAKGTSSYRQADGGETGDESISPGYDEVHQENQTSEQKTRRSAYLVAIGIFMASWLCIVLFPLIYFIYKQSNP